MNSFCSEEPLDLGLEGEQEKAESGARGYSKDRGELPAVDLLKACSSKETL
jgi:hypothetical protein